MELDDCGMWIDKPINVADWLTEDECPMPPGVPPEWFAEAGITGEHLGKASEDLTPEQIALTDPAMQADRMVGMPQGEPKNEPTAGIWNLVRVASRSGTSDVEQDEKQDEKQDGAAPAAVAEETGGPLPGAVRRLEPSASAAGRDTTGEDMIPGTILRR
jgi:hypothetical protein